MDHLCDNLDRFLIEDLDPQQRRAFERHLQQCASCRRQLETQQQIDSALAQLAETPAALPQRLRQWLQAQEVAGAAAAVTRRHHLNLSWAVAIACTIVLVAVGLWSRSGRVLDHDAGSPDGPAAGQARQASLPVAGDERPEPPAADVAVAVFQPDRPDPIAVRVPTHSRNVTLVMVYPVTPPRRRDPAPESSTPVPTDNKLPLSESTFSEF